MKRAIALLLACGCAPTYAPPIRSPHAGAPGRAREGDVVLGGAALGVIPGATVLGGPNLAYGLRDWVALEGGADIARGQWAMGWAGARFTHAPRRDDRFHYASDLETGLGFGWGGELCGNGSEFRDCKETDDREAQERMAGGGLLGIGVAGHLAFFSVFARSRVQLTSARGVPPTLWGTLGTGFQFRIARIVDLYTQASFAGYTNRLDATHGFVYELGIAIRIPPPW